MKSAILPVLEITVSSIPIGEMEVENGKGLIFPSNGYSQDFKKPPQKPTNFSGPESRQNDKIANFFCELKTQIRAIQLSYFDDFHIFGLSLTIWFICDFFSFCP